MQAGIETIAFYTPRYYLDLHTLAKKRGVEPDKFRLGIGQEKMAVPPPDEDIVTMAATAAREALAHVDIQDIDMLMFATESGIDQSKAAAIYAHSLLKLPSQCQSFELKQACCSGTAGLQLALAHVRANPKKKVLLLMSDIARYGLGAAGEPTQGAGAIAMVISSTPKVLAIDSVFGGYTEDVMDFWRPNYMEEALVDGKYSIKIYLRALSACWKYYQEESGRAFADFNHFCYHLPFTRMAEKAHAHLVRMNKADLDESAFAKQIEPSLSYNRETGNCYTASLYEGLLSLLQTSDEDLSGKRIGLFSYGSGCMAVFFSGTVLNGYVNALEKESHRKSLDDREKLSYKQYENFYTHRLPTDGRDYQIDRHKTGAFRLAGIRNHKRQYEVQKKTAVSARQEQDGDRTVAIAG
jgi:hydroxymethylglutaryl-CoA synthase